MNYEIKMILEEIGRGLTEILSRDLHRGMAAP
jgi:hypothetical protein